VSCSSTAGPGSATRPPTLTAKQMRSVKGLVQVSMTSFTASKFPFMNFKTVIVTRI
jgi:hypothetical protein